MSNIEKPLIMRLNTSTASGFWEISRTGWIISDVQNKVESTHYLLPKTTDDLYREYNTLMSSRMFTSIREFVEILEVFAHKNFPGIQFSITPKDNWYELAVIPSGENSARSMSLLKKWLRTGILSTVETTIKVITSRYDSKTKIFNETMISHFWNEKTSSLIYFDVNQFKRINDEVSHTAGDFVLEQLAQIFRDLKRKFPNTTPIRNWGDEFVIITEWVDTVCIQKYIAIVDELYAQIAWTYGVSSGYYSRMNSEDTISFIDAFAISEKYMQALKDTKWRDYRIRSTIQRFSRDERITLMQTILPFLSIEEREDFIKILNTD